MSMIKMTDLDLTAKRVLIRADLNVPIKDGVVTSQARILAALPTIQQCLDAGALVRITSHLGRPKEGQAEDAFSLQPVVEVLQRHLNVPVRLEKDYLSADITQSPGTVVVLENVRFNHGELGNDEQLAQRYAALCDIFVMDAFGTAHRAQASTHGVGLYAPIACAGPLLVHELTALGRAMDQPQRPMVAIVGGSKVSTKLSVLESLAPMADQLIVGGGIANTFIAAAGHPVGRSLYEADLVDTAKRLMGQCDIPIPTDVACAKAFDEQANAEVKAVGDVAEDDFIFDLGPDSTKALAKHLAAAKTILWNGPVGVFEFKNFAAGTAGLAAAIAASDGFSVAGGGDTLAAIEQFNIAADVSYISTGGGAFLEFIEGKTLPAVAMLEARAQPITSKNT